MGHYDDFYEEKELRVAKAESDRLKIMANKSYENVCWFAEQNKDNFETMQFMEFLVRNHVGLRQAASLMKGLINHVR
jgi:hypothetical protein